jgi:hypothetical protein
MRKKQNLKLVFTDMLAKFAAQLLYCATVEPQKPGREATAPSQHRSKFRKYKGGIKCHTIALPSSQKMFKWHHSALKA